MNKLKKKKPRENSRYSTRFEFRIISNRVVELVGFVLVSFMVNRILKLGRRWEFITMF